MEPGTMYERAYREGVTFEEFLATSTANRDLWHAMAPRARVAREITARVRGLPGRWRLLAIADDWCGDAVNILPVVARLVEGVEALDLRIVGRDAWPQLMDRHLTNGARSIPVFILLDDAGACRGWWGPRPSELQAWFEAEGRPLPKEERYRELRRWYARDRGTTIAEEILHLVTCAAVPGSDGCDSEPRPCPDRKAA